MMINSGQCSDPAPRQEGCDPEACSERAGGDHAETCECFGCEWASKNNVLHPREGGWSCSTHGKALPESTDPVAQHDRMGHEGVCLDGLETESELRALDGNR